MPESPNRYLQSWDDFWGDLSGDPAEVLWDVDPDRVAIAHLPDFKDLMDLSMPLIDIGCGNGTQTPALARHFPRLIGVDVSPQEIEIAQRLNSAANIEYRVLDMLDLEQAIRLHDEIGDANLYMRAVLMQFSADDRPLAVRTPQTLLGKRGVLYLFEYPPEAMDYYDSLIKDQGMPLGFNCVLKHGITPGGLSENDLASLFPGDQFETLRHGDSHMQTVIPLDGGGFARPPAIYIALRPKPIRVS